MPNKHGCANLKSTGSVETTPLQYSIEVCDSLKEMHITIPVSLGLRIGPELWSPRWVEGGYLSGRTGKGKRKGPKILSNRTRIFFGFARAVTTCCRQAGKQMALNSAATGNVWGWRGFIAVYTHSHKKAHTLQVYIRMKTPTDIPNLRRPQFQICRPDPSLATFSTDPSRQNHSITHKGIGLQFNEVGSFASFCDNYIKIHTHA